MTPACKLLEKNKIPFSIHEYEHDGNAKSFGLEAAEKLNLRVEEVCKTLTKIYVSGGKRGLDIGLNPQDLAKLLGATFSDVLDQ